MSATECVWLGADPCEPKHLLAQAEVLAAETNELLDLIAVGEGASVIDIGCGALGILPTLSATVGVHGRVVGLDLDRRSLEAGERAAAELGLEVEIVHADARDTGLAADSFDLVHERAVLSSVTDPEAVVAEMARIVRAGGVVALQEPDSAGWVCDPPHPAWELLQRELLAASPRAGRDFDIGRRTVRLLRAAGLRDVNVRVRTRVTAPGDFYQTFLLNVVGRMRAQILAATRLTRDRLDSYLTELHDHLAKPGTLTCQPAMWQAWGTKQ